MSTSPENVARASHGEVQDSFIAAGGCGAVYRIRKTETEELFARKVMRWVGNQKERQQAENEVKAATTLCTLGHPNIIQTFEHGVLDNFNYFIDMELCDLNLKEFLRGEKVRPNDWFLHWPIPEMEDRLFFIMAVLQEIANGLCFIHLRDLVHRDLKPENILYSYKTGWWKIADFGLATAGSTATLGDTADRRATECYAAPEVLRDFQFNKKSDIWALGCILYEVCTGRRAFNSGWSITTFATSSDSVPFPLHPFVESDSTLTDVRPLNEMVEAMLQNTVSRRPTIIEVCERVEAALYSGEWAPNPDRQLPNFSYFGLKSLVGTETPIWNGRMPSFEELVPTRTYSDVDNVLLRQQRILEARRLILGREHLATIWTKLLLGWTTLFSPQDPTRCNSAWTFLNSARNDLQELYKDKTGQHPFDVIIQYALALCASRAHPTGSILHSTSEDDFELVIQKLWGRPTRPLNVEQILDVKFNLLFSEYGSKSVKTASDVEEIERFVSSAQEMLGPEHPITLCGLRFLRMVSMSTSNPHPRLVTDSLEMIETIQKVLGPDHGLALLAQLNLAQMYIADGSDSIYKARGLSLLTEILPPVVRRYGPDNPIPKHIATLVRRFGTQRPDRTVHYLLTEANQLLQKYQL